MGESGAERLAKPNVGFSAEGVEVAPPMLKDFACSHGTTISAFNQPARGQL